MEANFIKCKHCGKEIEVSEALSHQIEEKISEKVKLQTRKDIESDLSEKFQENLKNLEKEREEERQRNKKLTLQVSELLDETRKLRRKDEERDLEMKKKLAFEEEKIREESRKKALEEHSLLDQEKEKKLRDALTQIEEMKKKIQQGSQQTQGEVLELEIESKLKLEFPQDEIQEVKKGQRGADAVQTVFDKLGRKCGVILWESKNATWSDKWIGKLKEDQRQAKADLAVLVSVNLPKETSTFSYINGVWVVGISSFLSLALALRFNLVSLFHERKSSEGKDEKMKELYEYLTGSEFKHRVEGIVESFGNLQDDIEKEKRWFNSKWARQEKEIRKVIDHTHGLYGDLQGVTGRSLQEVKSLELPE